MLKGGKSGPAIVLGKPDESLVIKKIQSWRDAAEAEAHRRRSKTVSPGETHKIAKWIAQGAPKSCRSKVRRHRQRSSCSRKGSPVLGFPASASSGTAERSTDRSCSESHRSVSARETGGQTSVLLPGGRPSTLIRRASFDLTGLPPEPAEVQAFLADKDPHAYEKLIDRLLASPRYGERWGRYLAGSCRLRGFRGW